MLVSILFYSFATILVASGVGVITTRNPVYAALSLVLCFFTSAVLWMLIEAEFLAIVLVQIFVCAGGEFLTHSQSLPVPVNGAWLIVIVTTALSCLRAFGAQSESADPKPAA